MITLTKKAIDYDLPKELLAWMAGFIDGEGTITICTVKKSQQHVIKLAVCNTNYKAIKIFETHFGGKVRKRVWSKNNVNKENWKDCYEWQLTAQKACKVIVKVKPYLKLKIKQANIALQLGELRASNIGNPFRRDLKKKEEIYKKYAEMKKEIQLLNKRGRL